MDDWLDLSVQNLFNVSLDPAMRRSAVGTVCSQLAGNKKPETRNYKQKIKKLKTKNSKLKTKK